LKRLFSDYQSLSTDAIIRYLSYLEDAFLLFSVNHYDTSLKRQIQKPKKLYCIDHGMMQAVSFRFSNDIGRIFENIVYIALLRQGKEIYYWQDEKGFEVDFVIKSRDDSIRLIQVSVDISDPMTREREKRGLISAMNYFEIGEGIIITSDILDEEIFQDRKITYFPLWFWLLTEESESYI